MIRLCRTITEWRWFDRAIIVIIIFNAIILGLATAPQLTARHQVAFDIINNVILYIFVIEAALKITAAAPRFQRYFGNGWNLFDFTIVVVSLLPAFGDFTTIARTLRLLRVFRLITALPELRVIVMTLIRSLPGLGNVLMLLLIIFYVYGIAGYQLFHEHDPTHWRSLGISLITLFRVLTLEDWTDVMYTAMEFNAYSWIFFLSFVVIAAFIVVNMVIAVVINNLHKSEALLESRDADDPGAPEDTARTDAGNQRILEEVAEARARIESLERMLRSDANRT